ncbi:hypothetical protein NJB1907f44_05170 [Mycobacterium marinum]|uniref:hypothetical protein n=1 Tax=Mycobacterium marinum TaxID=1781 RepID=UPI001FB7DF43|nr:hypothetical protein [Mycobacterium marinum]GJN96546.1 hypothetical protein NJB1808e29_11150 [Mycobacterium marinum]GJN98318.1 hypothetical protein NJB1907f34b_09540 [Mycobacterium marinum]GJO02661.1 hypothetical protein NJB1907E90_08190 [Mycobacterium marinum]GJO15522.1 hypothetical protein NJB1728e18_07840 [Mycobacterium marinum]GJO17472.1 hypothetical protein NJB1907E11_20270 [Mycobacterium marinum]
MPHIADRLHHPRHLRQRIRRSNPHAIVAAVLKAAKSLRYYPAPALIAVTGLHRGEALALWWDRSVVNLDGG